RRGPPVPPRDPPDLRAAAERPDPRGVQELRFPFLRTLRRLALSAPLPLRPDPDQHPAVRSWTFDLPIVCRPAWQALAAYSTPLSRRPAADTPRPSCRRARAGRRDGAGGLTRSTLC